MNDVVYQSGSFLGEMDDGNILSPLFNLTDLALLKHRAGTAMAPKRTTSQTLLSMLEGYAMQRCVASKCTPP